MIPCPRVRNTASTFESRAPGLFAFSHATVVSVCSGSDGPSSPLRAYTVPASPLAGVFAKCAAVVELHRRYGKFLLDKDPARRVQNLDGHAPGNAQHVGIENHGGIGGGGGGGKTKPPHAIAAFASPPPPTQPHPHSPVRRLAVRRKSSFPRASAPCRLAGGGCLPTRLSFGGRPALVSLVFGDFFPLFFGIQNLTKMAIS